MSSSSTPKRVYILNNIQFWYIDESNPGCYPITVNVTWNGEKHSGNECKDYNDFVNKMRETPISLTPYKGSKVIFLYPKIKMRDYLVYDRPVHYDINKFTDAFDVITVIEEYYQETKEDKELRKIILDSEAMEEYHSRLYHDATWAEKHDEKDFILSTTEVNLDDKVSFYGLEMIHPGVYKVNIR